MMFAALILILHAVVKKHIATSKHMEMKKSASSNTSVTAFFITIALKVQ